MKWLEHILALFNQNAKPLVEETREVENFPLVVVSTAPAEPTPEPTQFEKAKAKFDPAKDILVMPKEIYDTLEDEDLDWVKEQGDKIFVFSEKLINVSLVRAGYGW